MILSLSTKPLIPPAVVARWAIPVDIAPMLVPYPTRGRWYGAGWLIYCCHSCGHTFKKRSTTLFPVLRVVDTQFPICGDCEDTYED